MKKTLLVLLTTLAMVFAFTACGGSGSDEGGEAATESIETISAFQSIHCDYVYHLCIVSKNHRGVLYT